ncbi:jasmonate-induced protein homolog [Silene latifolia]|uniref:jasmonate-induced protein homolog n=1 Tax=Silene latifolia TaxID=37657 RepID=UPI003D77146A
MASVQVQRVGEQTVNQPQDATYGTIFNHTWTNMNLITSHSWSGSFTFLPDPIPYNGATQFVHRKGDQGTKGAVVYTMPSRTEEPYAIVLAWDAPANHNPPNSPNRVYIECGPRDYIESQTWYSIQRNLDIANPTVEVIEEDGKIKTNATINRMANNPAATLNSHFRIIS